MAYIMHGLVTKGMGMFGSANESHEKDTAAGCPLCDAVQGTSITHKGVNVNSIITTTRNFILIPALGPLVTGHVLAVSKIHSFGLAYLTEEARMDYGSLALRLRQHCDRKGDGLLEAEHGGVIDRGPCIQHTHIHLLPRIHKYFDALSGYLPPLEFPIKGQPRRPYIWMRNGAAQRLYDASDARGQEIRRALGEKLLLDDWDWAINPKWEMIRATMKYWGDGEWLSQD